MLSDKKLFKEKERYSVENYQFIFKIFLLKIFNLENQVDLVHVGHFPKWRISAILSYCRAAVWSPSRRRPRDSRRGSGPSGSSQTM